MGSEERRPVNTSCRGEGSSSKRTQKKQRRGVKKIEPKWVGGSLSKNKQGPGDTRERAFYLIPTTTGEDRVWSPLKPASGREGRGKKRQGWTQKRTMGPSRGTKTNNAKKERVG